MEDLAQVEPAVQDAKQGDFISSFVSPLQLDFLAVQSRRGFFTLSGFPLSGKMVNDNSDK